MSNWLQDSTGWMFEKHCERSAQNHCERCNKLSEQYHFIDRDNQEHYYLCRTCAIDLMWCANIFTKVSAGNRPIVR